MRNGIQQISGRDYGIEEEIGCSSFLSGGKMENELHVIHCPCGVISISQVSNAILEATVRMSFKQRIQPGSIGLPAHVAADIGISVNKETFDQSPAQKTRGASNEYFHTILAG
jgi:hypothetical protein